jgi:hypothetical protein
MPATRGPILGFFGSGALVAASLSACTLITDIDREKIPQPESPVFPEIDAGPQPTEGGPDAGTPDASVPPEGPADAGDAGLDAGAGGDAGPDAGDAG